jgi:hypothetical protein
MLSFLYPLAAFRTQKHTFHFSPLNLGLGNIFDEPSWFSKLSQYKTIRYNKIQYSIQYMDMFFRYPLYIQTTAWVMTLKTSASWDLTVLWFCERTDFFFLWTRANETRANGNIGWTLNPFVCRLLGVVGVLCVFWKECSKTAPCISDLEWRLRTILHDARYASLWPPGARALRGSATCSSLAAILSRQEDHWAGQGHNLRNLLLISLLAGFCPSIQNTSFVSTDIIQLPISMYFHYVVSFIVRRVPTSTYGGALCSEHHHQL